MQQQAFTVLDGNNGGKSVQPRKLQEAMSRAMEHQKANRLTEAVSAYDEALAIEPGRLAALVNKGSALRQLGRPAEAMECYWRAVPQAPDNLQLWCNCANALHDLGRYGEAHVAAETALRLEPRTSEAWLALGNILVQQKHLEGAETAYRRCLSLAPDNSAARLRLAGILEARKPVEALAEFAILREKLPDEPSAHSGHGQALISLGRLDEAEPSLRRALDLAPDHLDARLGMARLLLLRGELAEGWKAYEWRRKKRQGRYPTLPGPEWDGSDLAGKTILVYAEQGFGDTLQFARYLLLLASRGVKVAVICQKSLVNLVSRIEGVASAQATWKPLPVYDFWCPMLTLPLRMGTTPETIPANVPYLPVPKFSEPLRAPLGTRLKVGLVWAGSATHGHDKDRSAGLEAMLPILGVGGVAFYSLQAGPRAADIKKVAHPALIADLSPVLQDFAFTAGIIEQFDLVIAVDTSVAHLAGALGKPVWVMIPHSPDWRWQRDRDDSPWYPTMRLFRQAHPGDWRSVIGQLRDALAELAGAKPLPQAEHTEIHLNAALPRPDEATPETPRFTMTAPRALLADPGIRFLVQHERAGVVYEYATRCFLDAHLQPGDLFIDIGAHWGIMSLHAVSRWPGQVDALALEPLPSNLPHLRRWLADNSVEDRVEVIAAAASDKPGKGELKPESTMGHSLVKGRKGSIPVVTVDDLLAKRPHLSDRRVIVKIDVEGTEIDVVNGMRTLLRSGRVAAVIWERGIEYENPAGQKRLEALRAIFDAAGFSAWRFESEDEAGPLVPFVENGKRGNVIELSDSTGSLPCYGQPRPVSPPQPADQAADAALRARYHFQASVAAHKASKTKEASEHYSAAAALDGTLSELFNNLGVSLRQAGRPAAAEASYRRALALNEGDAGILSNLANVVRELGNIEEAERLHAKALAQRPEDGGLLYNAGVIQRDAGQPEKALVLLERALAKDPENRDIKWDRALCLLQRGDYAKGFPAYEARWGLDAARKRKLAMPVWDGAPLEGRNVFLTDEQGFGDVLQFARFIPELKKRGAGKVIVECQPELMRLMAMAPGVDAVLPRDRLVPACDLQLPLLSIPGVIEADFETPPREVPYLQAPPPSRVLPDDGRLKVGLAWAGKLKPRDRSIPLEKLLPLLSSAEIAAYSLQVGPRAADLKSLGAEAILTDLGSGLTDFADTASILTQLDLLVTIDTSVAHLAGALAVPTFLLLRKVSDWRWFDEGSESPWYPSFRLFRQAKPNDWDAPIEEVRQAIAEKIENPHHRQR